MVDQFIQWSDNEEDEDDDEEDKNNGNDLNDIEFSFRKKMPQLLHTLDWNNVYTLMNNIDSMELISEQYKQKILSMRHQLTTENYVIRASSIAYSFDRYEANDFERKSSEYIKQMGIYTLIQEINIRHPMVSQTCLTKIIKRVDRAFYELLDHEHITIDQYDQMRYNRSSVKLNYLYFVLDTKQEEMHTIRPMIICKDGPTMGISRYLSRLLWSIFDQETGCRTFSNGAEIVEVLELYSKNKNLRSNTLFAMFNINEFSIKFPFKEIIKAVEQFLSIYGTDENMEGMSIETIVQLIRLVLQNQFFVYRNKLYRQTKGGASGSPLTTILGCIYMFHHRPTLMAALINQNQNELFGRFRNDMFLTWHRSEDELRLLFDTTTMLVHNKQHSPIKIIPSIGSTFHFLDVEVSHHHGHLHTKIYHDSVIDQYALRHKFPLGGIYQPSRLLQAILIYAVRCCSDEESFHYERRYIKLIYLLYGFPVYFIDDCIQQFYKQFHASEVHYLVDRVPYHTLRQRVVNNYLQLLLLKKHWLTEIENIQSVPYSGYYSNSPIMANFICHLSNLFKKCFAFEPQFHEDEIELLLCLENDHPLSMNNHLMDQKPLHHLLTLPNKERNEMHHESDKE